MTRLHMIFLFFFFLMIRRPPRSTLDRSSAASDVYKRQGLTYVYGIGRVAAQAILKKAGVDGSIRVKDVSEDKIVKIRDCLLYTSPSPRDRTRSRMPSSA